MFVDHIKVQAKAGAGGRGCVSFRREKFVPKGGPDGGDGGRGGDIILHVDDNVDSLAAFYYEPILKARHGQHGLGKNMYGRAAKPVIVKVPPGTLVYRMPTVRPPALTPAERAESNAMFIDFEKKPKEAAVTTPVSPVVGGESERELIADLTTPGEEFLLCRGGQGGKGNVHFKSSRNRVPTQYTDGEEGEEGYFYFELRKIADAGFVGYPNAGKSTLLGKISAAHPKVASYPFTTLHPMVGIVEFPGFQRASVADIPGLIEGAHRNVGLGHDFLRHIIRCKLLIFVVDIAGSEGRSPIDDLAKLREELKLYDATLADRPWIVVANKIDLPDAEENLKQFKRRFRKVEVIPVSAEQGIGIDKLKARLAKLVTGDLKE